MRRIASVLLVILVIGVAAYAGEAIVKKMTEQDTPAPTEEGREHYKGLFVDACVEGGGEYGVYPGFREYCGCSFDLAEQHIGSWTKIGGYVSGMSTEELTAFAAPCMSYIQV